MAEMTIERGSLAMAASDSYAPVDELVVARNFAALQSKFLADLSGNGDRRLALIGQPECRHAPAAGGYNVIAEDWIQLPGFDIESRISMVDFAADDPKNGYSFANKPDGNTVVHIGAFDGLGALRRGMTTVADFIATDPWLCDVELVGGLTYAGMGRLAVAAGMRTMPEVTWVSDDILMSLRATRMAINALNGRTGSSEPEPMVVYLPTPMFVRRFGTGSGEAGIAE